MSRSWITLLAAIALTASAARASGPIFVVNSTADAHDAAPGDGKCETADGNGVCTLRAAVEQANASAGATVQVPAGTFPLSLGSLLLTQPMTISGAGAGRTIVSGGNVSRVVLASFSGETRLQGMTLRDGLESAGALVAGGVGAAFVLERTELVHGSAGFGGCFYGDALRLVDSYVHDCHATTGHGGAVYVYYGNEVRRSTISGSTAFLRGGGIYAYSGPLAVVDSTISGNTAGEYGGGVAGGGVSFFSSSLVGNRSSQVGGGGGVAKLDGFPSITFVDTLFSGNQEPNQAQTGWIESACSGTVNSVGYNLMVQNASPNCIVNGAATMTSDMKLGPLQDNGGFAPTHALLAGSPAIDFGNPVGCADVVGVLAVDARGAARSTGAKCDTGAYEKTPCGDANGNGTVEAADVFLVINYLFAGGPRPVGLANVNQDGKTDVQDVFYLINRLFGGGPAPVCPGA
jgi:CSLREA domain-containing protein